MNMNFILIIFSHIFAADYERRKWGYLCEISIFPPEYSLGDFELHPTKIDKIIMIYKSLYDPNTYIRHDLEIEGQEFAFDRTFLDCSMFGSSVPQNLDLLRCRGVLIYDEGNRKFVTDVFFDEIKTKNNVSKKYAMTVLSEHAFNFQIHSLKRNIERFLNVSFLDEKTRKEKYPFFDRIYEGDPLIEKLMPAVRYLNDKSLSPDFNFETEISKI